MALIAIAIHDTEENKKTEITRRCLLNLFKTVDTNKHRVFLIDNDSYQPTKQLLSGIADTMPQVTIITNQANIGTAEAINKAWKFRQPGDHCIKMDNDVIINHTGWVEEMEEAIRRNHKIGIVGLKRKDCWEHPKNPQEDYRSELEMLYQDGNGKWMVIEKVKHVIGTCQMYNSDLLDKIGYLYQPGLYGYDDVLASWRSQLSGYINCFLPYIDIDHIDNGGTSYQSWKERHSGQYTHQVIDLVNKYIAKEVPLYYEPNI